MNVRRPGYIGVVEQLLTERLVLTRPLPDDESELFALCSDERVWRHYPSLRHTDPGQTRAMLERWTQQWDAHGLGVWVARGREDGALRGYGGCSVLHDAVWNLGYRLSPEHHGHGYATELARAAIDAAQRVHPDLPVIAYLLANNEASAAVARRLGMREVHRGPDAGNPDPDAVRLVFAERALTAGELAATLR